MKVEDRLKKIYTLLIVILIIVSVNFLMTLTSKLSIKDTTSTTTTEQTTEYDVSMFKSLTEQQVVDLFNDKNATYVVYLGRSTCSACVSFVPTLKAMQTKYNFVTQYLDITTVKADSDSHKALLEKLSSKVTLTVNGSTETKSYGEYYGYTPMTFIIKNGKFVDGIVGAYSESSFESFLNENGIK